LLHTWLEHRPQASEGAPLPTRTEPNPAVGCVIVKDGAVVGEGYHPKAGEPHAEVFALRAAGAVAPRAPYPAAAQPSLHLTTLMAACSCA